MIEPLGQSYMLPCIFLFMYPHKETLVTIDIIYDKYKSKSLKTTLKVHKHITKRLIAYLKKEKKTRNEKDKSTYLKQKTHKAI